MILVSACLLGFNTKYDGTSNANPLLKKYSSWGKFIPICPEQLGGLPTPRVPAEIVGGSGEDVIFGPARVKNAHGEDWTSEFIQGAQEALKAARLFSVKAAILKERSPSCGVHCIYDGTFNRRLISGPGVTAALLYHHQLPLYSEEDLSERLLEKLLHL